MKKLKAIALGICASLAFALALIAPVPAAQAGVVCNVTGGILCGTVRNANQSGSLWVKVYDGWGKDKYTPAGNYQYVYPKQTSTWKDADGLCAQPGTQATVMLTGLIGGSFKLGGPGQRACRKISDGTGAIVTIKKL